MSDYRVEAHLRRTGRRIDAVRLWTGVAAVWAVVAGIALAVWLTIGASRPFAGGLLMAGTAASGVWWLISRQSVRTPEQTALDVEHAFPGLDAALMTAIERPTPDQSELLRAEIADAVRRHSRSNRWESVVTPVRLAGTYLASGLAGLAALAGLVLLLVEPPPLAASVAAPDPVEVGTPETVYKVVVEPGDAEVERGKGLLISARFAGAVPPDASIEWAASGDDGEPAVRTEPMTRSLDDPLFGGRIDPVDHDLEYAVVFGSQRSPTYRATVFEYPRLERADATLTFPDYTEAEPRSIRDVRRLTAIAGTRLELTCLLNKPVASAELVEEADPKRPQASGRSIALTPVESVESVGDMGEPRFAYAATQTLARSGRYRLMLIDGDGRENVEPPLIEIRVLSGKRPVIKRLHPRGDVDVSPIEEVDLEASVWDDYGVRRAGLTYEITGQPPVSVTLVENGERRRTLPMAHQIALEAAGVAADDLVALHFWADDVDERGEPRHTAGDLFFATVRPFDRTFRQGEPPPKSPPSKQQMQQTQELLKLQKQIVQGAWNAIRQEEMSQTPGVRTPGFGENVGTLGDSQRQAIGQLDQALAEIADERSRRAALQAGDAMEDAARQFDRAKTDASVDALEAGRMAAQAAYQRLLQLRKREIELVRAQQGQGSGGQQQKLDLELKDEKNRYETQSQAEAEQDAQQQEDRQLLNRLRELARRQDDLNSRIKELQTAFESAETPQEREEIERRLQRLRDQQQEIVRDAEELQQRMQREENDARTAEMQQQLEQAREQARRSSEALKDGQVSRAAAEGTRAAENFEQLREQMQRQTSSAFAEELRTLREQASEAMDRERQLAEAMGGRPDTGEQPQPERSARPSLRGDKESGGEQSGDPSDADSLREQIADQRQRVAELTEAMRQLVTEAEQSEPLLADKLYDAIRQTRRATPEEALRQAELSVRRGRGDEARQLERVAREGLGQLQDGIEEAAESVLGDEVEALRRASRELEELTRQLDQERERATGEPSEAGDAGSESEAGQRNSQGRSSESESGSRKPDDPASRSERGQPQEGERGGEQDSESSGRRNGQGDNPPESESTGTPGSGSGQRSPRGERPSLRSASPRSASEGSRSGGSRDSSPPRDRQTKSPRDQSSSGGLNWGGGEAQDMMERTGRPAPIGGDGFRDWSDRLRDVEEVLSDPKLRGDAAAIRDRAKAIRRDVRRHSAKPNWDVVTDELLTPLVELQRQVDDELLRRTSDELVPIDRVPVPERFRTQVERYYERLGAGR